MIERKQLALKKNNNNNQPTKPKKTNKQQQKKKTRKEKEKKTRTQWRTTNKKQSKIAQLCTINASPLHFYFEIFHRQMSFIFLLANVNGRKLIWQKSNFE